VKAEALEGVLLAFLRDDLRVRNEAITRETELVSEGLIDSTDLVLLATHLERTLDLEIPDEDISVDNFDSVAMILDYVERKLGS
jgi:acyl carrier protein